MDKGPLSKAIWVSCLFGNLRLFVMRIALTYVGFQMLSLCIRDAKQGLLPKQLLVSDNKGTQ